ncbi:uncharacterized protein LOC108113784 [Drosophila eugracilis]|uniref:uncharacterized protein LOC108113784 n=1 Tax=Drosophila eugracilis TaxID=29029 RepID=UPI001BDAF83E|nr:uncharacterized protein LOC108113784 [Drosophila eugracilis]
MQFGNEGPYPGEMRVYLFRKLLTSPTDVQREVSEQAIAEVLNQVLTGRISTIFICGGLDTGNGSDPTNIVTRILGELFTSVYSMEMNMEVNVSVRYVELNGESDDLVMNLKGANRRASRDHFVATSREVNTYIEKVMYKVREGSDCPHLIFTISVIQANNAKMLRTCCGKLQLVYMQQLAEDSPPLESDKPLNTLLNLFQALGYNLKSHIRYHNIKLTRLFKQLMGNEGRTVLINYKDPADPQPQIVLEAPAPTPSSSPNSSLTAEIWSAMFRQERRKYVCLREKVLEMIPEKKELEQFLESLESGDCKEAEEKSSEGDVEKEEENRLLQQTIHEIRLQAEASIAKLQDLEVDINSLTDRNHYLEQQLDQKNTQLDRQCYLLRSVHMELIDQKRIFQDKLAEYAEMFQGMWQQQSAEIQEQEHVQRHQLSKMFDTICQAFHLCSHKRPARMLLEDELEKSPVEDPKL